MEQESPRRPCDILVANVGPQVAKTAKTAKCVKKCAKLKMFKTALSGVSQQSSYQGVCQSVLRVSECCTSQSRPVQAQRPCPAFPSLLQLTPARPGPRSLAELPRGLGRVLIIEGALQGPEDLTVPRDVPRRITWPYPPPAHRNCAQAEKLHIYSV